MEVEVVGSALHASVPVGRGAIEVPVPSGWEELPPLPGVPFLAREGEVGGGFRSNVTVSVGRADGLPDALVAGEALAAELGGVLVDAVPAERGALLVVGHGAAGPEVVCVQRQLRLGDHLAAVTYTVAIDRFADTHAELLRLAGEVRPA